MILDGILPVIERYYTEFSMFFKLFGQRRVYLDYASSTPLDQVMLHAAPSISPKVLAANPHALHREGVKAKAVLEGARASAAATLRAHPDEIIFTSGATESDNLALLGVIYHAIETGIDPARITLISSDLEHAAVREVATRMTGINTITIPTTDGVIDPKHIMLPEDCVLAIVSIMYVSNEIGTVQPIRDIAKRVRYLRKQRPDISIILHTDATQAPAHYSLNVQELGVDLMTLGATKLYTHKGVGILYKKRSIKLAPIMYGGGQEFGLRPGTEPIALVHMCAHALKYAQDKREEETARVTELRNYFEHQLQQYIPEVVVTAANASRSPHISHIALSNFDSELLVIELDAQGIAVSAKSACKNEDDTESPIMERLYGTGWGAVRFSFGRMTTKKDIDRAVTALKKVVQKYKKYL
jgi:cysteine desulfurase